MADGLTSLEELEWDKLAPVGPYDADRLEFVIEDIERADALTNNLAWQTEITDTGLTVEEVLGALGEAKHLLDHSQEVREESDE